MNYIVGRCLRRVLYSPIIKPRIRFNSGSVTIPPEDTLQSHRMKMRETEPIEKKKARLLYQSRKRGMLENDLLLSTFVGKYLDKFDEKQTAMYDTLINSPSNDWDIYYWATNTKPTPPEYDHEIMDLLKEHTKNIKKESRIRQPDL
ncbi:unnamed protein product [Phaedon cochleariae]|uniref:Succinate dehydrogenase assembly factor 2, mitochondrial n=1 Tax=Phaedon cochleariae TaxID=80249 RepID=A0A9P0DVI9_PHACE|nr:unnamed protein product [Phaedon cochleariae]